MKKTYLPLVFSFLLASNTFACPAFPFVRTIKQSDGTSISYIIRGNEHLSFATTIDGHKIAKNKKGDFCYAQSNSFGELIASDVIAHNEEERDEYENQTIQLLESISTSFSPIQTKAVGSQNIAAIKSTGSPNIPVLLVEFSDVSFKPENTIELFDSHFNGENYEKGSAREYFKAQSNGIFTPHFSVLGKVKLLQNRAYYGAHSGLSNDVRAPQMVKDAISMAIKEGIDLSTNIDVNTICVIYAGEGEHVNGPEESIWAHVQNFSANANGKNYTTYLAVNEIASYSSNTEPTIDGIGTFCHEFSHVLGIPDFYNTNSSDSFDLYYWSSLDYGYFWNEGKKPVGYTAYEREFMGWLKCDTLSLDKKQMVTLTDLGSTNKAIKILNPNDPTGNEYYILENRQYTDTYDWYPKSLGSGLLVFHIDYNSSAWNSNTVNTKADHKRMSIIPADGTLGRQKSDLNGDLYPGTTGNHSLTSYTNPSDIAFNGGNFGLKINNINEENKVITFAFMADGILDIPIVSYANLTFTSFNVEWEPVDNAETYYVSITNDKNEQIKAVTTSSNELIIDSLEPNSTYYITVKAQTSGAYIDSEESKGFVTTGSPNSIEEISSTLGNTILNIYSSDGKHIAKSTADEINKLNLSSGIYLIKTSNGTSFKIKVN